MKILSVLKTALPARSGDGMEEVFVRLMKEGHELHVAAPERGPLTDRLEGWGVQVHLQAGLPVIDGRRLGSLGAWARLAGAIPFSAWRLARLMGRLKVDVVHTNSLLMPTPALAAMVMRRPHVWHARELVRGCGWLHRAYLAWVGRGLGRSRKAVVAVSESARGQFGAEAQTKVQVIHDGLDDAAWEVDERRVQEFRAQFPAESLVVGVVGRIKWHRKGQEVVVRAASMLRESYPQARYVFVGRPDRGDEGEEARLRELIEVYGLQEVVTIVAEPPTRDSAAVYAALDVLAAPLIRAEALDRTVARAMAVGTAVVVSQSGGVAEMVEDGETGVSFPVSDFEQLARELDALLGDPEKRRRLGEAARDMVRDRFSLTRSTWEMVGVLLRAARRD